MLRFNSISAPRIFNQNINLKNLNPSELGWIRPDTTISFQSPQAAQAYAKKRVLQALNNSLPFERGILIKKNVVLGEINGSFDSVDLKKYIANKKVAGSTFFHGHPEVYGEAMPVSIADFLVQVGNKIKNMVAFNKDGEFSILEEKIEKKFYNYLPAKVEEFFESAARIGTAVTAVDKFSKMWAKFFPAPLRESVNKMMHAQISNELLSGKKVIEEGKSLLKRERLVKQIALLETQIYKNGAAAKSINDFWKANADRWGYRYRTNFSNLKNAPGPF